MATTIRESGADVYDDLADALAPPLGLAPCGVVEGAAVSVVAAAATVSAEAGPGGRSARAARAASATKKATSPAVDKCRFTRQPPLVASAPWRRPEARVRP